MVGTLVTHIYKFKKEKKRKDYWAVQHSITPIFEQIFFLLDWIFPWKGEVRWFVRLANPSVTCNFANTMLSCQTVLAKQCRTASETTNLLRRLITILGWTTVWRVQSSANNTLLKKNKMRQKATRISCSQVAKSQRHNHLQRAWKVHCVECCVTLFKLIKA